MRFTLMLLTEQLKFLKQVIRVFFIKVEISAINSASKRRDISAPTQEIFFTDPSEAVLLAINELTSHK